ncbi:MAG: DNA polymerase III subunit gamma/tau [Planctomycetes bacterium]|nr:DNA polymerase III subunit gamma/tau [Planctomycetota bacterium]
MDYLVLPRKYRPRTFSELVGQDAIVRTLSGAIEAGRIAQGFLFCGPHGVGKTSTARILAKALNCEKGPTAAPCLECPPCRDIEFGRDLDVREVNGADNRGVDEVRAIIEDVRFAPSRNRKKVFIIDEVHQLTEAAFNALLKTLEEPPAHVVFILATTQPSDVPATILSRCQRYDFRRAGRADIVRRLSEIVRAEKIEVSEPVLFRIADRAAGSLRDSQKILDQLVAFAGNKIEDGAFHALLGLTPREEVLAVADEILSRRTAEVLDRVDRLYREGRDVQEFVAALVEHFRTLLLASYPGIDPEAIEAPADEMARIREQAGKATRDGLVAMIQTLFELENRMRRPSSHRVLLEIAFVKLAELSDLAPLSEVLARLDGAEPAPRPALAPAVAPAAPKGPVPAVAPAAPKGPVPAGAPVAAARPAGSVDLAAVRRAWPEALREVASGDPGVEATFSMGEPAELSGDAIVVRFESRARFAVGQLEGTERLGRFESALATLLGRRLRIRPAFDEARPPEDEGKARRDPRVEKAMDLFDGQVVEVRRPGPKRGGRSG